MNGKETTEHVTIEQTQAAMLELIRVGKPNGKLAFYKAALSILNPLDRHNVQCSTMDKYANRPLPVSREELWLELGGSLFHSHINTLYEIEKLWNSGIIHFNCGHTQEDQEAWRRAMVAAIPGMAMKSVSFALHIYAPFQCLILTVDRHHLKRLAVCSNRSPSPCQYIKAEKALYEDVREFEVLHAGYAPIVIAAYFWENWRQEIGVSTGLKKGEYQSHASLSCYV